jgi:hypothetical protein
MFKSNRIGWVKIDGERLSVFHRQLIQTFPHYASVAVSEGMLPGSDTVLSYEERQRLGLLAEPSPQSGQPQRELVTVEGRTFEKRTTFDGEPTYRLIPRGEPIFNTDGVVIGTVR